MSKSIKSDPEYRKQDYWSKKLAEDTPYDPGRYERKRLQAARQFAKVVNKK